MEQITFEQYQKALAESYKSSIHATLEHYIKSGVPKEDWVRSLRGSIYSGFKNGLVEY